MTAIQVALNDYELGALINWHLDQEIEAAKKKNYIDAQVHKVRRAQLIEIEKAIRSVTT